MKTVLSKILLAQVLAVVMALLVVTVLTRFSLDRGFKNYLEQQETQVLQTLAPALADLYESRGSWGFLVGNPRNWERIWRQSRPPPAERPRPGQPPPAGRPPPSLEARTLRWVRSLDRPTLRQRLILLDAGRQRVAGAATDSLDEVRLQAIELDGETIGWVGFTPMGNQLPPDAERFMRGHLRLTAVALLLAGLVAVGLGFLLARQLSRPVRTLSDAVNELTRGNYETRSGLGSRDEIGNLGRKIDLLADTLEKNRTARQRWMADVAHELRTPVAIMKGEIEALNDGVRAADESTLSSLAEEVGQLAALVDDLQALALADAGALNLRKQSVDLAALAAQSAEPFRHRLEDRGIRLEIQAAEGVAMSGDPQRLRQLFHNLLENSCRYVEQGGSVRLLTTRTGAAASIVLEDSGPGVSEEQLDQLFTRFYRAEESRSRATGGSGLGLSICRNIVEAHGGTVTAEHSRLGGLAIRISIPD